ncbi:MAG: hypothetical protein COB60_08465 [Flavobacteriaceae bacterium]|nr:MAG: hypothetical protein COB60_08465 [Flavobacteriaceae bacterium]
MKNLENYGVQELNGKEIMEIDGGGFWEDLTSGTSWSGTSNKLIYAGEALYNGGVMTGNLIGMGVNQLTRAGSAIWSAMSSVMPV